MKKLTKEQKELMINILECWEWNNDDSYLQDINYNKFLDKLYEILEL